MFIISHLISIAAIGACLCFAAHPRTPQDKPLFLDADWSSIQP